MQNKLKKENWTTKFIVLYDLNWTQIRLQILSNLIPNLSDSKPHQNISVLAI